jgi:hypothetical protein
MELQMQDLGETCLSTHSVASNSETMRNQYEVKATVAYISAAA